MGVRPIEDCTLGEAIKDLRERLGYSQGDVSRLVNKGGRVSVSRQKVSRWESDTYTPTIKELDVLSGVLGCSFMWLISKAREEND